MPNCWCIIKLIFFVYGILQVITLKNVLLGFFNSEFRGEKYKTGEYVLEDLEFGSQQKEKGVSFPSILFPK